MRLLRTSALMAVALGLLAACATKVTVPTEMHNPPPKVRFNEYSKFELKWTNKGEGCKKQHGGEELVTAIDVRLHAKLDATLRSWEKPAPRGTLVIEPVCADAKLIGTAARIFTGPLSGSSVVVFKLRFTDQQTGERLAEPVFYQRAAAMSGAYTFGVMDRQMMNRVVELMNAYTTANYAELVGGATGVEKAEAK